MNSWQRTRNWRGLSARRRALALAAGMLVLLCSGCTSLYMTKEVPLATTDQAYPHLAAPNKAEIPPEATKMAVYEAAFEDVFRFANVSASQAQFEVETVDAGKGLIFATRSTMMSPFQQYAPPPSPHRFFYAIQVKELAAKRTEVRIMAKVQGKCQTSNGAFRAFTGVFTLGVSEMALAPISAECKAITVPGWALGFHSTEQEMGQFQTFLRNNLLVAGLL